MEQKSNNREFAHMKGLLGDGRASEQLTLAKIRETYIFYNTHMTCSNSSFLLSMVTPTSHFFAFHWSCCLFPIGYFCRRTYLPPSLNSTTSIGQGYILLITLLILSSAGCSCLNIHRCTAPVDMITFR